MHVLKIEAEVFIMTIIEITQGLEARLCVSRIPSWRPPPSIHRSPNKERISLRLNSKVLRNHLRCPWRARLSVLLFLCPRSSISLSHKVFKASSPFPPNYDFRYCGRRDAPGRLSWTRPSQRSFPYEAPELRLL